jgi:hypothetical protein
MVPDPYNSAKPEWLMPPAHVRVNRSHWRRVPATPQCGQCILQLRVPQAWFILGHFWVTDGRAEAAGG